VVAERSRKRVDRPHAFSRSSHQQAISGNVKHKENYTDVFNFSLQFMTRPDDGLPVKQKHVAVIRFAAIKVVCQRTSLLRVPQSQRVCHCKLGY
jgi:hypothetical protein